MTWEEIILWPPVAMGIILCATAGLYLAMSRLSTRKLPSAGGMKPYACGEETPVQALQPNYEQFFPFAFFFTILHVVALMVTTVPMGIFGASVMTTALVLACVYVSVAVVCLLVLYKR